MNQEFTWQLRIYYEDTDASGLVYHGRYVNFFERARTEWLRDLGFEQDVLATKFGILFVVHSMKLDYLKPARFNDQILVHSQLSKIRKVSMLFAQHIYKTSPNILLCKAAIQIACIDSTKLSPVSIPTDILQKIWSQKI